MSRHRLPVKVTTSGMLALFAVSAAAQVTVAGPAHMSETLRSEIDKVVVVGGTDPAEKEITGTYEEMTPGLYGGISRGAALGSPSMEVGPVNVSFPIPILTLPGAIAGGLSGKYKRELQEFRDALAEELAGAASQPLKNSRLALGVFRNLERQAPLESELFAESVTVPEDADAVLYVSIDNLTIEVDDEDAVLTTAASLSLRQQSDGMQLYERTIAYQDRAALSAWTANDNALFRDYANYALHFLGREIAADAFTGVEPEQSLVPRGSASLDVERRDPWQGTSKSASPTLAWQLELAEGAAFAAADAAFDVEIYDNKRLVYSQTGITGNSHAVAVPLEACKTYRWTVRPAWNAGRGLRFGEWMRKPVADRKPTPVDLVGRDAARAPAYIQDFARLTIDCRAG